MFTLPTRFVPSLPPLRRKAQRRSHPAEGDRQSCLSRPNSVSSLFGLLALSLGVCSLAQAQGGPPDEFVEGTARPETVAVGRMPHAPKLDGHLDDWPADATRIVLGEAKNGLRRHFQWAGTKDSAGVIWLAWDDEALYLAADVSDDKPCTATGAPEIYHGDSLEIFFNRAPYQYRTDTFWQIAIAPNLTPKPQADSAPKSPANATAEPAIALLCGQKEFAGVTGGVDAHPGGYTMEVRIPWKNLDGFLPRLGESLGMQLMLDDRDGKGRKSQQIWYPSAVTFAQPTHMNTLLLTWRGDTARPRMAAGTTNWCLSDPKKMSVSAIIDDPNAKEVRFELVKAERMPGGKCGVEPVAPATSGAAPAPAATPPGIPAVTLPMERVGDRLAVAQGVMDGLEPFDGLCDFRATITGGEGDRNDEVLGVTSFQAQLSGAVVAKLREMISKTLPQKMKDLKAAAEKEAVEKEKNATADSASDKKPIAPLVIAGLDFWLKRCQGSFGNEAKPEVASRRQLDQLLREVEALDDAIATAQTGQNPYARMTGSFVKAYTSPLTGQPRPIAFYIPADYHNTADNKTAEPRPLIYVLHGVFADERQLLNWVPYIERLGAIVVQAPAYRIMDWGGANAAESWAGLDAVRSQYRIDPARMSLVGHAPGGRGVLQMAEARPDLWAAAAAFLTGADTGPTWPATRLYPQYLPQAQDIRVTYSLYQKAAPPAPFKAGSPSDALEKALLEQASLATRAENLAGLPLRHSYGEESPDTTAERLALADRLAALGRPLASRYVPGAAHGAVAEEWAQPAFWQWLLAHRKPEAAPTRVAFTVAGGLRNNTAWWVSVEQLENPAELVGPSEELQPLVEKMGKILEQEGKEAAGKTGSPKPSPAVAAQMKKLQAQIDALNAKTAHYPWLPGRIEAAVEGDKVTVNTQGITAFWLDLTPFSNEAANHATTGAAENTAKKSAVQITINGSKSLMDGTRYNGNVIDGMLPPFLPPQLLGKKWLFVRCGHNPAMKPGEEWAKTWAVFSKEDFQKIKAELATRGSEFFGAVARLHNPQRKQHGLSGPIDDAQFGRLLFVYGTQSSNNDSHNEAGSEAEKAALAALAKTAKKIADWGLGAAFECKADRDVTDAELAQSNVILIGTPQNNALIARFEKELRGQWLTGGDNSQPQPAAPVAIKLGDAEVSGPGAAACWIQPSPALFGPPAAKVPDAAPPDTRAPRYMVVITALDDDGYALWQARGPGDDFLLGNIRPAEDPKTKKPKPTPFLKAHGVFDNQWRWSKEGTVLLSPKLPAPLPKATPTPTPVSKPVANPAPPAKPAAKP